jgi:hypothetical protein
MNTLAASLVLATLLATSAPSAVAATDPTGRAVLVVECGAGNRPSQRAVADLIGDNNSHRVYKARSLLMAQVRSACAKAGITQVALVGRPVAAPVAIGGAAPASRPIAGN